MKIPVGSFLRKSDAAVNETAVAEAAKVAAEAEAAAASEAAATAAPVEEKVQEPVTRPAGEIVGYLVLDFQGRYVGAVYACEWRTPEEALATTQRGIDPTYQVHPLILGERV